MRHEADIVIVGGGLVGLCTALALAQNQFRVCLIHNRPLTQNETDDGRAYALSASSCHMLRHMGLGFLLETCAQPMWDIVVSSQYRPSFHFTFSHERDVYGQEGDPFGYLVEAHSMQNALAASVAEHLNITLLADDNDGVNLPTHDLLVISEGKNGQLAARRGVIYFKKSYQQTALVGTLEHTRPHNGVAYECFCPTGPLALLPITGQRTSFVWVHPTSGVEALWEDRPTFTHTLQQYVGDCLGQFELHKGYLWRYPLQLKLATRLVGEGFCLIGDSAHVIHPLAGQGLNLGLRDGCALVDVLLEARTLGLDIGSMPVLAQYENWRWTDIGLLALSMHTINSIFASQAPWLRPIQTLGLALFDKMPFIKHLVAQSASGLQGTLPSLTRPLHLN